MNRYVLALDLGASSGRAMLAAYDGEKIRLREVHRFSNDPVAKDGRLYWNVPQLMREIEQGMQAAYEIAPYESIAIDTWGVELRTAESRRNAPGTASALSGQPHQRHSEKGRRIHHSGRPVCPDGNPGHGDQHPVPADLRPGERQAG